MTDHRSRPAGVPDLVAVLAMDSRDHARRAAVRACAKQARLEVSARLLLIVSIVGGLWMIGLMGLFESLDVPRVVRMIVGAGGLTLIIWGGIAWSRRRAGPVMAVHLCRAGFCGSCGYTLRDLAPEPDGCTVCPECEAAWRVGV